MTIIFFNYVYIMLYFYIYIILYELCYNLVYYQCFILFMQFLLIYNIYITFIAIITYII